MDSENMSTVNTSVLDAVWISNTDPSVHGSASTVNFEGSGQEMAKEQSLFTPLDKKGNCKEDYEGCFYQPEKKRRLAPDQVQFLERSFEVENKLEPERKVQLAKEVGLQPRQVSIWFQNRRARCKTKQIEKDYDSLKARYDILKADHDSLSKENENLRNEVQLLTDKLIIQEQQGKAKSEPTHETNNTYDAEPQKQATARMIFPKGENFPMVELCKHENASLAKSDILDSDSPHFTDGNHSSFLEPGDSSHVFESDFSQDEDDSLSRSLFQPSCPFPKLEDHGLQPQASSCNLGFSIENQATSSWLWPY